VPALRERLASVFLDTAQMRIDENRNGEAARAIKAARELSPNNPRLQALEQKLQAMPVAPPAPNGG
jgi:hypothetical protein